MFWLPPAGVSHTRARRLLGGVWRGGPPQALDCSDEGEVPAGCSFWGHAMQGQAFYTVPERHYNCAVGCHTHGIALPEGRTHELEATLEVMVESGYCR